MSNVRADDDVAAKSWIGPNGGLWNLASDWTAGAVPVAGDEAVITGLAGASYLGVTGPGAAGSLTVLGNVALGGSFSFGALAVGAPATKGALQLLSGVVQAGSASLLRGPLEVSGAGTRLSVTGTLTLGGTRSDGLPDAVDVLFVHDGASVQAASILLTGPANQVNSIQVAAGGTVEVGSAGGVPLGVLAVDAGRTLSGAGFLKAANGIRNAGTITAQSGTLNISSPVSGSGTMQIGAGATLALTSFETPSTVAVNFAGPGGTLQIGGFAGTLSETGLVTGFAYGDTIAYMPYGGALLNVTYASTSYGLGTLTFNGTAGSLGSLRLAGDFSAYSFVVTPDPNGMSDINLVLRGNGGAASAGTAAPDAYLWRAGGGGDWGAAANWTDLTTGANPAAVAPGVNNNVTLRSTAGTALVSGRGNSASLTVIGAAALNGAFATGALQVGTASETGTLGLAAGTTVDAASATIGGAGLQATGGGTRLSVAGTVTLRAVLGLTGGATVRASDAVLASGTITVDRASSLELGGAGTVSAGQVQVDAGHTLSGAGRISAAAGILDSGTITAQGGTLTLDAPVSGGGVMQIGAGATLALVSAAGASTAGVTFAGGGGTLQLALYGYGLTEAGLISGFAPGHTIAVSGVSGPVAATYQQVIAGYGRVTLSSGGVTLGTLNVAGDYSGYTFQAASGTDGAAITLAAAAPAPAPAPHSYAWTSGLGGAWSDAASWQDLTTGGSPAQAAPGSANPVMIAGPSAANPQVITGPGSAASLSLWGNLVFSGAFTASSLDLGDGAQTVVSGGQLAVSGAASVGSGLLVAAGGGRVMSGSLTLGGGTVRADGGSLLQVGAGPASGTGLRVQSGATLAAQGGRIEGDVTDAGTISNTGALTVTGSLTGAGTLALGGGLTDIGGSIGGGTVGFTASGAVLRVHGLQGGTAVTGMRFGDVIDLAGITGARLAGNTLTASSGTLTLAPAPDGYLYKLYGDARDGTALLLNPAAPPAGAIKLTDAATLISSTATGDDYEGPVDYLQRQYIWSGSNGVAMAAAVPNAFLKGGPGSDALMVAGGNNVLDGSGGSNFLIGGSGADGGRDTFFLDARGGAITWSTLVNFHQGDQATIFGFNAPSTRVLTANEGVTGYTGLTIHSEIAGPGTGITASMTFAGIDQAAAAQHFVFTQGTLPGDIGYLLIQYT